MRCHWLTGVPHVDARASAGEGAQGAAVSERSAGFGVGVGGAVDPAGQTRRAQALGECARGAERHLLRAVDRLPMGGAAQGPAAEKHGMGLLRPVGVGRHAGAHSSRTLCELPRTGRAGGQSLGRDHRQPERPSGAKRGAQIDPQGYDAGKKSLPRRRPGSPAANATSWSIRSA